MTRHVSSLAPQYFEQMFQGTQDPWSLETSAYEQAKYAHSIEALGERCYELGFEIGCAKGMLTRQLAEHCRALVAIDVSETALSGARERCAVFDHVSFNRMTFPAQVPLGGPFDLIILSEVIYYWDNADIRRAAKWAGTHGAPGGDLLLVHWTGETDYPQSGDEAVEKFRGAMPGPVEVVTAERRDQYRLDLWRMSA